MNFKSLLHLTATAFCAVAMFSLASCSDDNDEPNNGNSQGNVNPSNVFQAGLPTNVGEAQIKTNNKGQVTEIKDGSEIISFEYGTFTPTRSNNFPVLMKIRDSEDPTDESNFYIKLNNQGFISYAYQVYVDEEEGTDEWWFDYNKDGQLTYMKRSEGGNEVTNITYTNGDITKVSMRSEDDGEGGEYSISFTNDTFKSTKVNKGCVMIFDAIGIDMDEMNIAYYAGLLGKATKNLPMGYVEIDKEGGESHTYIKSFNWEFNSNDLPTKFWVDGNEYDAITFAW